MPVARQIVADIYTAQGDKLTLRRWRDDWLKWTGTHWETVTEGDVKEVLYLFTEHATYTHIDGRNGVKSKRMWDPTRSKIMNVLDALEGIANTSGKVDAPAWIYPGRNIEEASGIIAFRNCLLSLEGRKTAEHTPAFFNLNSVPYDYDPAAGAEPVELLKFLRTIWPDDQASIDLLQEWFGYVLSGRTDLHKFLLFLGPPRSGKGTIARILTAMIGHANTSGLSMAKFASNFGMSDLIGKMLGVIGDARLKRDDRDTVLEILLNVTGEDSVQVDIKHRAPWSGILPVRLMMMSNNIPSFLDESGALESRILPLATTISFLGREDRGIEGRVLAEMPQVLNWALAGLQRLQANGGVFTTAASADGPMEMYRAQASPVATFLNDRCEIGGEGSVTKDELYGCWRDWCEKKGREHPGQMNKFATDLYATGLGIRETKVRVEGKRERRFSGVWIKPESEWSD